MACSNDDDVPVENLSSTLVAKGFINENQKFKSPQNFVIKSSNDWHQFLDQISMLDVIYSKELIPSTIDFNSNYLVVLMDYNTKGSTIDLKGIRKGAKSVNVLTHHAVKMDSDQLGNPFQILAIAKTEQSINIIDTEHHNHFADDDRDD